MKACLDIPVLHDDHGTAVVVLAALRNALAVTGRTLPEARIVVLGAGAAHTAVTLLLLAAGARDVTVWTAAGVLHRTVPDSVPRQERQPAALTNPRDVGGGPRDVLRGADAVIGLSAAGVLTRSMVAGMAERPIVFALAHPVPEIDPGEISGLGAVIATGRSDHPNQVDNALAVPGLFRGALDARLTGIGIPILLAAAAGLADLVPRPRPDRLLPDVLDPHVVPAVAAAVRASVSRLPTDKWK